MSGTAVLTPEAPTGAAGEAGGPSQLVRRLQACLDELVEVDPGGVADDELADLVRSLEQAAARLAAVGLSAVRAFDERGVWASPSALGGAAYSAANWLTTNTGTSRADAAGQVRLAAALSRMPEAAAALAAGEITPTHVRALAAGVGPRTRAAYARDEAMLVGHARRLTADQTSRVMRYWLARTDPDGAEPDDPAGDQVFLSRVGDGRWVLRGEFATERGAELAAAVQEQVDELVRHETALADIDSADPLARRSAANRRAEALAELVARGSAAPATTARRRPAFTVLLDAGTAAALRHGVDPDGSERGRRSPFGAPVHELDDGTVIDPDTLRLWLCDSHLCRVVLGAEGEPLDVGRLERTATPAQRRALTARDRGCAVYGCDRPAAWCDAHHITFWDAGGETNIDNLVLLCRHHHRRIHRRALAVRMVDHRPVFTLPDGTQLTTGDRPRQGREPPDDLPR